MSIAMETSSASVSTGSGADLSSEKSLEHQQITTQAQKSRSSTSPTSPSPHGADQSASLQIDLGANLSAILNAAKNNDVINAFRAC